MTSSRIVFEGNHDSIVEDAKRTKTKIDKVVARAKRVSKYQALWGDQAIPLMIGTIFGVIVFCVALTYLPVLAVALVAVLLTGILFAMMILLTGEASPSRAITLTVGRYWAGQVELIGLAANGDRFATAMLRNLSDRDNVSWGEFAVSNYINALSLSKGRTEGIRAALLEIADNPPTTPEGRTAIMESMVPLMDTLDAIFDEDKKEEMARVDKLAKGILDAAEKAAPVTKTEPLGEKL